MQEMNQKKTSIDPKIHRWIFGNEVWVVSVVKGCVDNLGKMISPLDVNKSLVILYPIGKSIGQGQKPLVLI